MSLRAGERPAFHFVFLGATIMTVKELKKYLESFDENLTIKINYDAPCEGTNCHMLLDIKNVQECNFPNGIHHIEIQYWE
jgi:hypothetical protein